jgi:hypothetical protein
MGLLTIDELSGLGQGNWLTDPVPYSSGETGYQRLFRQYVTDPAGRAWDPFGWAARSSAAGRPAWWAGEPSAGLEARAAERAHARMVTEQRAAAAGMPYTGPIYGPPAPQRGRSGEAAGRAILELMFGEGEAERVRIWQAARARDEEEMARALQQQRWFDRMERERARRERPARQEAFGRQYYSRDPDWVARHYGGPGHGAEAGRFFAHIFPPRRRRPTTGGGRTYGDAARAARRSATALQSAATHGAVRARGTAAAPARRPTTGGGRTYGGSGAATPGRARAWSAGSAATGARGASAAVTALVGGAGRNVTRSGGGVFATGPTAGHSGRSYAAGPGHISPTPSRM